MYIFIVGNRKCIVVIWSFALSMWVTVVWQIWHSTSVCPSPLPPKKKIQHPDTLIEQSVKYSNRTVTSHNTSTIENIP